MISVRVDEGLMNMWSFGRCERHQQMVESAEFPQSSQISHTSHCNSKLNVITDDNGDDKRERDNNLVVDWLKLPSDVVTLIFNKLPLGDITRCGAVCQYWKSLSLAIERRSNDFPWLLMPNNCCGNFESRSRCYSFTEKRMYLVSLPGTEGYIFIGSDSIRGWIVALDPVHDLCAINPITREHLVLPSIVSLPFVDSVSCAGRKRKYSYNHYLRDSVDVYRKILLTMSLSSSKLMVIFLQEMSDQLSIARVGDTSWTVIKGTNVDHDFVDAVLIGDELYAIDRRKTLFSYRIPDDLSSSSSSSSLFMTKIEVAEAVIRGPPYTRNYLVVCEDNLFMVCIFAFIPKDCLEILSIENIRVYLQVFKLDMNVGEWVEVKSLNGHAFFLGMNYSTSLVANEFEDMKSNCVYFHYINHVKYEFACAYNIEHQKVKWFYPRVFISPKNRPMWFIPRTAPV